MPLREYRENIALILSATIIEYAFHLTSGLISPSHKNPKTNRKKETFNLNWFIQSLFDVMF